jgi:hypothetical protein
MPRANEPIGLVKQRNMLQGSAGKRKIIQSTQVQVNMPLGSNVGSGLNYHEQKAPRESGFLASALVRLTAGCDLAFLVCMRSSEQCTVGQHKAG